MVKKITQKSRTSSKIHSILITGGSGSIGKVLLPKLIDHYKIYALGRKVKNFPKDICLNKNFHFIECDYQNVKHISIHEKIDCVIHLGGQVAGKSISFEDYKKSNLDFTKILLEFAKLKSVKKFIFSSSVSVYGKNKKEKITEDSKLEGISDYAISKILAENILLENKKVPVTIFRIGSVYGENNKSFINKLIHLMKKRIIPFLNYGRNSKNFIYIGDLVEYFLLEIKKDRKSNIIFNIVNPEKVEYPNLIRLIQKNLSGSVYLKIPISKFLLQTVSNFNRIAFFFKLTKTKYVIDLSPLTGSQEISATKAIQEYRYSPKVQIEEGIDRLLNQNIKSSS
ncbi:MAG: NAD(P)-dependent oxidoreductase [Leptospiraceae bacterium]|nr:NAD(P)-dependent oxidoreductase [Leptospiraceae bacterium]MCK6379907.1 NAD(P)-dependent oxidoreductase [Leptospiraceae bacterium]NUM40137.1 NAD(P)-dependent oxidoreductase [Leptospiraceae bacterium]